MKTLKKVLAITLAAIMVFSLAACGQKQEEQSGRKEVDTYNMIANFDITTLDYVFNNKSSNGDYTSNFIEGLLTQDSHGTLVGGMAEKWEANADGSVWTFTIRKGAKWVTNQGEEYADVTAQDFVTGLKHAADTHSTTLALVSGLIKGLAAYADGTGKWEDVGIKADGQTLTYTLNKGCGYFDGMTTYSILWPINAQFLESQGDKFGAVDPAAILYNGCFILSSVVSQQEVKFVKNAKYWDKDNVFISDVTVSYTDGKDPAEAFNLFVNGETYSTSINSSYPDIVAKADELYKDNQYKSMTTATSYWGAFNGARALYALYTNPEVKTTVKNEAQQADTRNAILNKYFRLGVYAGYSTKATQAITKGDERALDAARNTLVPYTFATTSKGESYGALLTKYVEELFITPKSFQYYMSRPTDEKWKAEQLEESEKCKPIDVGMIEKGVVSDVELLKRNEFGRPDLSRMTDLELCSLIDKQILPRMNVQTVYDLSVSQRRSVGNSLWTKYGKARNSSGKFVTAQQLKRCLIIP